MAHFLIIGSGLVGRLLAWRLLIAGNHVDILSSDDREGTDSAGYIAAAMIAPSTEAVTTEAIVQDIGRQSLKLWPQWLAELPETVSYHRHGTLVVAHSGDRAEVERFETRARHVIGADQYSILDQTQLADREPELADQFDQALFFRDEACLDNRHLYRLLGEALNAAECRWCQCAEIKHLHRQSISELSRAHFSQDSADYQAVIDCRGNGASADIAQLRSVRGEVIRVHAPEVNFKHTVRLLHPRYPLYLAPRPDNEYVLGATVIESSDRSPVSVRSGLELLSALYSLSQGFAESRILEMSAHCRPALANNMPEIKQTEWGFSINGFYRHGYLFAPAIIDDLLSILSGRIEAIKFSQFYQRTAS